MKNTIKVERAILSLTQDDLAKKIGVSRQILLKLIDMYLQQF